MKRPETPYGNPAPNRQPAGQPERTGSQRPDWTRKQKLEATGLLLATAVFGSLATYDIVANSTSHAKPKTVATFKVEAQSSAASANNVYMAIEERMGDNSISYDDVANVMPSPVHAHDLLDVEVDKVSNRYEIKITDESGKLANTD